MVRFIRLLLNEKGRFLWSAHRITERQKAGKARSIKGKQLKNSRSTVSKQLVALRSSPRDNFHCFSVRLWTLFCRKLDGFGVVRVPQKCSVLLRKEQARSTQGTRIASENKSLMKQEIVPQGAYLLLFCAARLFLLPFRSC
jgi:hypothetical protein